MKKQKQKFNLNSLPKEAILPKHQQLQLKGGGGGIVEEDAEGF